MNYLALAIAVLFTASAQAAPTVPTVVSLPHFENNSTATQAKIDRAVVLATASRSFANMSAGSRTGAAAATTKSTPISADFFSFWDSVTGGLRKLTWTNIVSTLTTAFNSVYDAFGAAAAVKDTTTKTGILKGDGSVISAASAGTDYVVPTGSAQALTLSRVGASTYSTVQSLQDIFHSAGYVSGGAITDAGGGNINVAAGTGLIRPTNSAVATISYFDWPASSGLAITTNTIRYVGIEYNSGTPRVTVRTSQNWDYRTDFPLGRVVNEAGTVHVLVDPQAVGDHASAMIQREAATMPLAYDVVAGGLMLGEAGTRNITLSSGNLWDRLNKFAIPALNTSVSGSFTGYYQDGAGGFTKVTSQTQWPNTQYDDGTGTLNTLGAGKYANLWFYVESDGDVVMLYGRATYNNIAAALAGPEPATVPLRITAHGRILGRLVFQKSASTAAEIDSLMMGNTAPLTGVTNHANLSNLDYASSGHTGFASGSGSANGTNTGDVTIGTANGLSIAGQVVSLQAATDSVPGAMTATDHALLTTAVQPVTGTFTPTLDCGTLGDLSVAYSVQYGGYTRYSDRIVVNIAITTTTFTYTTASGGLRVRGFPFTSNATSFDVSVGSMTFSGLTKVGYTQITPRIINNTNIILLIASGSALPISTVAIADTASGTNLSFTMTLTIHL